MKLTNVKALVAVAETGSIRSAAAALNKTQSALTKEIRRLETEIGLTLFLRTSRGVIPTEAGSKVLSKARSIHADLISLDEEIANIKGSTSSHIRISAAPLATTKIIPRAVARLKASFPDVAVTISSDLFGDALKALREGQHDLILGPTSHNDGNTDLKVEHLLTIEIAIITSRSSPFAKATSLRELTDCYWAMMGDTVGTPKLRFQEQFTRQGAAPPNIRLASESRLGLLALIQELGAVSTYPAPLLAELNTDSDIVRIPIQEALKPLDISLITRPGQSMSPAALHFAECIRQRARILQREWD